jgi:SAM-dependent methyltransferase
MSGNYMNLAEFANIAASERDFWWYRGMRRIFFRLVAPYLDGRHLESALEVGCGTGYMARLLQKENGWPLIASDIGWEGLWRAREMGVQRPVQANALELPFPDAAFDLLLSLDVMPHFPRGTEVRAAREWTRVLAPGGLCVVRTAALNSLRSRHSEFVFERQRFTRPQLTGLFAAAGLRVLRCTYLNSLLMPIALFKFRVWEALLRRPPASGVEPVPPWLNRLLHAPLAFEASWVAAGHNFPIGQTLFLIGEKIG